MLQVYGIPNCQTVKKARVWLEEHAVDYTFHNFKTEAPTAELLQAWLQHVALDALVNKRGPLGANYQKPTNKPCHKPTPPWRY